MSVHGLHGRGSPDDGPDEIGCPCTDTEQALACADAGCGFCVAAEVRARRKKHKKHKKGKQTICLDFDGVIHAYTSGWQGDVTVIPDGHVEGVHAALAWLNEAFVIKVYSTRCMEPRGRDAVERWLVANKIEFDEVCSSKPPAVLYVDDRGYRFDGDWNTLIAFLAKKELLDPWNKKSK